MLYCFIFFIFIWLCYLVSIIKEYKTEPETYTLHYILCLDSDGNKYLKNINKFDDIKTPEQTEDILKYEQCFIREGNSMTDVYVTKAKHKNIETLNDVFSNAAISLIVFIVIAYCCYKFS